MITAVQRAHVDVVHFHGARQFHLMLAPISWRAAQQRLPLVIQERGYRTVGHLEAGAQKYGLRRASAVLAASEEGVQSLRDLGVPADRLQIVSNGYDEHVFFPTEVPSSPSDEPYRILVVSRLSPEKDPLTMARGIAEYTGRGYRTQVTVVSGGPLRREVEALLRAGGVPATFVNHVSQADLADAYREAQVLVLTSPVAGSPQVILEAMACGLPVIASDVAGVRNHVRDAGLLVPVGNSHALAEALERLLSDPGLWQRSRTVGLERSRKFTWHAVASRIRLIYEEII
jgi:glycosyltransferase involved in cell wall biosynthesis